MDWNPNSLYHQASRAATNDDVAGDGDDEGGRAVIPRRNGDYASRDYWDGRFAQEVQYEWLLPFDHLRRQIEPLLMSSSCSSANHLDASTVHLTTSSPPSILVLGCGNSPFSADLYDAGFFDIVNVDFSETVIARMKRLHSASRPRMRWLVLDMTDMGELDDEAFDFVFDKAAMDSLLANEGDVWNPDPSSVTAARSVCRHIARLLKPGGRFVQVSLVQPHFRRKYLLGLHPPEGVARPVAGQPASSGLCSEEFGWTLRVEEVGAKAAVGPATSFGYYMYIMTKDRRGEDRSRYA
jgi:SAM-dependent methyltransferase